VPIYKRYWGTNKIEIRIFELIPKKLINDMNPKLIKPMSLEEFKFATKSMAKNKSLGLDEVMVDCYVS
jgi:abortive infection bacteriophage resistance protein